MTEVAGNRVAIVGGGLAGLAAAVGLSGRGLQVELFEARRRLGGRAGSFSDPQSGELIDYCQHISMGCCTNLTDFCRRTGVEECFRRDPELRLFTRDGRSSLLRASRLLPAPLHLAPALFQLHYLSLGERIGIGRAMWALARSRPADLAGCTVSEWLRARGQTPRAIEQFWGAVLVSALGESVERASMLHAQKVFVDAYLTNSTGYELHIPSESLAELYGDRIAQWLMDHGVTLHVSAPVEQVEVAEKRVRIRSGAFAEIYDAAIIAVPWQRTGQLLSPALAAALPEVAGCSQIDAAPITGVHLWFDRPITELAHAAMVDMLSQWMFRRSDLAAAPSGQPEESRQPGQSQHEYYYQVVISASRQIAGRERSDVVAEVCRELADVWPAAREAKLLRWKLVTDPGSVFSVRPGIDELRPSQTTGVESVFLAGDWTRTGWPATMEGAVRSGYLAAEGVLRNAGTAAKLVVPDLPIGRFAQLLFGKYIAAARHYALKP